MKKAQALAGQTEVRRTAFPLMWSIKMPHIDIGAVPIQFRHLLVEHAEAEAGVPTTSDGLGC
jgi:hypothetical protein